MEKVCQWKRKYATYMYIYICLIYIHRVQNIALYNLLRTQPQIGRERPSVRLSPCPRDVVRSPTRALPTRAHIVHTHRLLGTRNNANGLFAIMGISPAERKPTPCLLFIASTTQRVIWERELYVVCSFVRAFVGGGGGGGLCWTTKQRGTAEKTWKSRTHERILYPTEAVPHIMNIWWLWSDGHESASQW